MWLKDPKNNTPSVSLTLMVISFLMVSIVSVLQILKKIDTGGMSMEMLYLFSGLYFGRRFSVKTKNVEMSSDPQQNNGDNK